MVHPENIKRMSAPPKRKYKIVMQPNADFDNERELKQHVETFHPGAVIKKIWKVVVYRCEIELPQPKGK